MRKKNIFILIIVIVVGFVLLNSRLYVYEANSNTSLSSSYQHYNEYFPEDVPVIGILIKGDEKDKYKQVMAEKLKNVFEEYNYENLNLLQYEKKQKPVDVLLNVKFKTELSRFPFYRKGKINFDFYNESLSYYPEIYASSIINFNFYGTSRSDFKGIVSRKKAKEIMIENTAKEFVKSLNNHDYLNKYIVTKKPSNTNSGINKKLFFDFNLSWLNSNKDKSLTSKSNEYKEWVMDKAHNVEFLIQDKVGKQIVINYKTESSTDEIIKYYNDLLVNKNIDYNREKNQNWQKNYRDKIVLGFNGLNTEDFKLNIAIDYLPLKEEKNKFSEIKTDPKLLKNKNVQIVYWDYNKQAKALEIIRRGKYSVEDIKKLVDSEDFEKDVFYTIAKLKIIQEEIQKNYWKDNIYPEKLENDYLNTLNKLKTAKYKDIDIFYQGLYYQNKANMLHSPEFADKAASLFKKIEYKGNYGYGKGAKKRLKQLKVMPYLSTVNFQELINELKQNDGQGEFLGEYELLLKTGEYEKAFNVIEYPGFNQKPVKVILYALLNQKKTGFELLENRDDILAWELSKAISYQIRGEGTKSSKILDEITGNYPEWQINRELNKLYLRTGLKFLENGIYLTTKKKI